MYNNPAYDSVVESFSNYNTLTTSGIQLGVGNYFAVINFSISNSSYIYTRKVLTLAKVAGLIGGNYFIISLGYATSILAFYLFLRGLLSSDVEFTRYYSHFLLFKKEP